MKNHFKNLSYANVNGIESDCPSPYPFFPYAIPIIKNSDPQQVKRGAVSIPGSGRSPGGGAWHSSILSWRIPWTEKSGRLQSTGAQRVGHD